MSDSVQGSVCILTELNYSKIKLRLEGTTADHCLLQTLVESKSSFKLDHVSQGFVRLCFKDLQAQRSYTLPRQTAPTVKNDLLMSK